MANCSHEPVGTHCAACDLERMAFGLDTTRAAFAREDIRDRCLARISEITGQSREEICSRDGAIHLCDDLGLDSLDRVELAMALEEEFAIAIPDDDVDCIEPTVEGLVTYLGGRLG